MTYSQSTSPNMASSNKEESTVSNNEHESVKKVAFEICFPFLLAGLGMVLAGVLLDSVQYWPVFEKYQQLFILVPALLGLKVWKFYPLYLKMNGYLVIFVYQHLDSLENCKHFVLKGNLEMTLASRLSTLANLLDANTKEIGNSK